MEDIKILEKMCKQIIDKDVLDLFENLSPMEIAIKIQNLIAKYKSLEKEIKLMKSININDNYIEKSKIKEKIEKINDETDLINKEYFIEILEELLES